MGFLLNPNQLRRDYDRPSAVRSVVQFDKFQRIFELILLSFLFHGDRGSREPAEGGAPAWAEPFLDRFVPAWAVPLLVWKMTQKSLAEQMIFFLYKSTASFNWENFRFTSSVPSRQEWPFV